MFKTEVTENAAGSLMAQGPDASLTNMNQNKELTLNFSRNATEQQATEVANSHRSGTFQYDNQQQFEFTEKNENSEEAEGKNEFVSQ